MYKIIVVRCNLAQGTLKYLISFIAQTQKETISILVEDFIEHNSHTQEVNEWNIPSFQLPSQSSWLHYLWKTLIHKKWKKKKQNNLDNVDDIMYQIEEFDNPIWVRIKLYTNENPFDQISLQSRRLKSPIRSRHPANSNSTEQPNYTNIPQNFQNKVRTKNDNGVVQIIIAVGWDLKAIEKEIRPRISTSQPKSTKRLYHPITRTKKHRQNKGILGKGKPWAESETRTIPILYRVLILTASQLRVDSGRSRP